MRSTLFRLAAGVSVLAVAGLGAVPAGASPTNVVQNGSFLSGSYTDSGSGYDTLSSGSTAISNWTVGGNSVDWIGTYWTTPDGSYSIDLNGNGPGSISQSLSTIPGATYRVSFWLSGNFDVSEYGASRTITVQAGASSQSFTFTEPANWNHNNMGWSLEAFNVTATSSSTDLTFNGDPNTGAWGPVLDNVSAVELVASSGAQCKISGWQTYSNPTTGLPWMNQGQCVSYFATMHDTPIGN